MKRCFSIALLIFSFTFLSNGQSLNSVFGTDLVEIMKDMKSYTIAVAKQMPEEKYDFRPVDMDTVRTFAEQMKHIVFTMNNQVNNILPGNNFDPNQILQAQYKYEKTRIPKDDIILALTNSFDRMILAISREWVLKLPNSRLSRLRKAHIMYGLNILK